MNVTSGLSVYRSLLAALAFASVAVTGAHGDGLLPSPIRPSEASKWATQLHLSSGQQQQFHVLVSECVRDTASLRANALVQIQALPVSVLGAPDSDPSRKAYRQFMALLQSNMRGVLERETLLFDDFGAFLTPEQAIGLSQIHLERRQDVYRGSDFVDEWLQSLSVPNLARLLPEGHNIPADVLLQYNREHLVVLESLWNGAIELRLDWASGAGGWDELATGLHSRVEDLVRKRDQWTERLFSRLTASTQQSEFIDLLWAPYQSGRGSSQLKVAMVRLETELLSEGREEEAAAIREIRERYEGDLARSRMNSIRVWTKRGLSSPHAVGSRDLVTDSFFSRDEWMMEMVENDTVRMKVDADASAALKRLLGEVVVNATLQTLRDAPSDPQETHLGQSNWIVVRVEPLLDRCWPDPASSREVRAFTGGIGIEAGSDVVVDALFADYSKAYVDEIGQIRAAAEKISNDIDEYMNSVRHAHSVTVELDEQLIADLSRLSSVIRSSETELQLLQTLKTLRSLARTRRMAVMPIGPTLSESEEKLPIPRVDEVRIGELCFQCDVTAAELGDRNGEGLERLRAINTECFEAVLAASRYTSDYLRHTRKGTLGPRLHSAMAKQAESARASLAHQKQLWSTLVTFVRDVAEKADPESGECLSKAMNAAIYPEAMTVQVEVEELFESCRNLIAADSDRLGDLAALELVHVRRAAEIGKQMVDLLNVSVTDGSAEPAATQVQQESWQHLKESGDQIIAEADFSIRGLLKADELAEWEERDTVGDERGGR